MIERNLNLLGELPVIRRAREYHLYDNTGRRFLDLYLNDGRAVLGHRPDQLSQVLKNTLAKGVYAEYPSHEEGKMLNAARSIWGGEFEHIRYYRSNGKLIHFLLKQKVMTNPGEIADPARSEEGAVSLWRPWLPLPGDVKYLIPVIPFPGMDAGVLVCAPAEQELPEGDRPSPVIAAGINRCLWTLKNLIDRNPDHPLSVDAGLTGIKGWTSRGPYLNWGGESGAYESLFRDALSKGILLPPDPASPTILPLELTSGDRKILKDLFKPQGG